VADARVWVWHGGRRFCSITRSVRWALHRACVKKKVKVVRSDALTTARGRSMVTPRMLQLCQCMSLIRS